MLELSVPANNNAKLAVSATAGIAIFVLVYVFQPVGQSPDPLPNGNVLLSSVEGTGSGGGQALVDLVVRNTGDSKSVIHRAEFTILSLRELKESGSMRLRNGYIPQIASNQPELVAFVPPVRAAEIATRPVAAQTDTLFLSAGQSETETTPGAAAQIRPLVPSKKVFLDTKPYSTYGFSADVPNSARRLLQSSSNSVVDTGTISGNTSDTMTDSANSRSNGGQGWRRPKQIITFAGRLAQAIPAKGTDRFQITLDFGDRAALASSASTHLILLMKVKLIYNDDADVESRPFNVRLSYGPNI